MPAGNQTTSNGPPLNVDGTARGAQQKRYFNGHEHDFEHIVEEGSKVNYISTGNVAMITIMNDEHTLG